MHLVCDSVCVISHVEPFPYRNAAEADAGQVHRNLSDKRSSKAFAVTAPRDRPNFRVNSATVTLVASFRSCSTSVSDQRAATGLAPWFRALDGRMSI